MCYFLSKYGNLRLTHDIFKIELHNKYLNKLPDFYQYILRSWDNLNCHVRKEPFNINDIALQPIYYNKSIKHNNKILENEIFEHCGIAKIEDIIFC